ncbi:MAG: hypothetical protein ACJA13_001331 [Paraglaciecola sp.]|jgi:hypothetical protein
MKPSELPISTTIAQDAEMTAGIPSEVANYIAGEELLLCTLATNPTPVQVTKIHSGKGA